MADVAPFPGLRYAPSAGTLAELIAPPYDIISPEQREQLYARSPHNVIRIEYGREEAGDDATRNKYTRARATLDAWTREGLLRRDDAPSFYLTEHEFTLEGERLVRRGFLAGLRLYPEGSGVVLPHERTIPKDRADRLNLLRATRVNTSPAFGLVEDASGALAGLLRASMARPADAEYAIGDERQRLWRLADASSVERVVALLAPKKIYLADGHHRTEVAREYLDEERAAGRSARTDDPAAFLLTYLCPLDDPGLRIMSTHRVLRGGREALDAAVAANFVPAAAEADDVLTLVDDHGSRLLRARPDLSRDAMPSTWRGIAVGEAEHFLIAPAVQAGAVVRYVSDRGAALAAAGGGETAVILPRLSGATIQRVSDRGERLPQKTTYFYPKAPAGLVLRPLD